MYLVSLISDILARRKANVNAHSHGVGVQRLGEKVRTLRKRQGMTIKALALALGFPSHSYISEIEHGKKRPSTEMIIQLADLFGVTIDQLVRDDLEVH